VTCTAPAVAAAGDDAVRTAWQRLRAHDLATMHRAIHGPPPAWRDAAMTRDEAVARLVRTPEYRRRAIPLYRPQLAFHAYKR
jgi:hypothetical protein